LIGNYGVPSIKARDQFNLLKHFKSEYIQPVGVVVADIARRYSHWAAVQGLGEWCIQQGVPAITGVDTRAIVTILREQGSTLGRITVGDEYDADQDGKRFFHDLGSMLRFKSNRGISTLRRG